MTQQRRAFRATGDSYIIDIAPPSTTFPFIWIARRRQSRQRGKVSSEALVLRIGSTDAFDTANIDETARQIGRAILDDSQIIQSWQANRP